MNKLGSRRVQTITHWGAYEIEIVGQKVAAVHPFAGDPEPSEIGQALADGPDAGCRVTQPMVRRGWLEAGPPKGTPSPNGGRGSEPFVPVDWPTAIGLVAGELDRIKEAHGSQAIFGGSYGWASAGVFHRAPSQLQRFLGLHGGFTRSVNTYSVAAAETIIPHVFGRPFFALSSELTAWPVIAAHTDLMVVFGGIPMKNTQVNSGGVGAHRTREWLEKAKAGGVDFINISPSRDDADPVLEAQWMAIRPNTDTALMLGLAHTLAAEGLHDEAFLDSHCVGYERFEPYLMGRRDGAAKDAAWAAAITGIGEEAIKDLARRMAGGRTLISLAWSLQRADHGEQPYWMAAVLAAMLGQIGLPGGGIGYGYGAQAAYGNPVKALAGLASPRSANPVSDFIPVARIADLLLKPGDAFDYNGKRMTYPDTRLVYWCGGNPFHHHQDLNRLVAAWQRPETVIVHEPWWTAMARHADIVLPAATSMERNDIGRAANDAHIFASKKVLEPPGEVLTDYDIFSRLGAALGFGERFTEGRSEEDWLRHLWDVFRQGAARERIELPDFAEFWDVGHIELPADDQDRVLFAAFRNDPAGQPLKTPSGRIEIYSETVAGFGYDDCPGHPEWIEPAEWLGAKATGTYPLHMISNQPKTKLHSQYDFGRVSLASKIQGREPVALNPFDAAARGIADGDLVRLYNGRGQCLAGAHVTDDVCAGVVVMATGAWYDPATPGGLDRHGNPNVLTLDKGTSRLAQAPISQTALVEVEKIEGDAEPVRAFDPPEIVGA
ncbi:MAG: molybdopterin-dependent oxidoreductase [Alphaproteobacteria bacterium]|nr:molybdopterin-dependent oxidoreductase [Alphaproteobacteria bacterium]